MTAWDIIHGTAVSYQLEDRLVDGEYGSLRHAGSAVMLYPGLSTDFGVNVEEPYEEIAHTPAHGEGHILEKVRNVKLGEELPFALTTHPQLTGDWPLLPLITGAGSAGGLGDEPDSSSWMKELAGDYSVFTGIMMEDLKVEIPGKGVVKESYTGFAGHRKAISVGSSPVGTEAVENTSRALVWNDISSIRMDETLTPTDDIEDCISDISFGFTSEISKRVHPESALTTKIAGVRVMSRKMFISLKLTWANQTFISKVAGSTKLNLELVIGAPAHQTTFFFGGLYWPKYVARATPKELIGDTITCIVDQPDFMYTTGGA